MRPASLLLLALLTSACATPPQRTTQTPPPAPPQSAPAAVPTLQPEVLTRYAHDRAAFTQGLEYLGGGQILESTGMVGESDLRISELRTGKKAWQLPLALAVPGAFGEGSTRLGNTIYQITWQDGVAVTYDAKTLQQTGKLNYAGEGWGLTHDAQSVIMSDGSPRIVWRDPKTFAVTRSIEVKDAGQPISNLNELEYAGDALYANVWMTDRIARIDPKTGAVTAWIDVSALTREMTETVGKAGQTLTADDVPNGIAYVPERGTFLLTGKRWPTIFEVKLK